MSDNKIISIIEKKGYSMPKPASTPVDNHPQPGAGHTMPKPAPPTNILPSTPPKK